MALILGCFYGIGIPILFTIIVYRNRETIKHDQVLRVLGTGSRRSENPKYYEFRKRFYKLYYRFKPRYFYWGSFILGRKFLVVLCTVFLKQNPTLQATSALMILFLSYSVHIRSLPYLRNDLLDCDDIDELNHKHRHHRNNHHSDDLDADVPRKFIGEGDSTDVHGDGDATHWVEAQEKALALINHNPKGTSIRRSALKSVKSMRDMGSRIRSASSATSTKEDTRKTAAGGAGGEGRTRTQSTGIGRVSRLNRTSTATDPSPRGKRRRRRKRKTESEKNPAKAGEEKLTDVGSSVNPFDNDDGDDGAVVVISLERELDLLDLLAEAMEGETVEDRLAAILGFSLSSSDTGTSPTTVRENTLRECMHNTRIQG